MGKKVFITGGLGYLGGRIAAYLVERGDYEITVSSRNPAYYPDLSHITALKVDARSDNLESILEGFDVVIHLAALDSSKSFEFPLEAIDVNISDTLRWKIAAEKASVAKFIYFSTIHVYGHQLLDYLDENSSVNPTHPYAITHGAAEQFVLSQLYSQKSKSFVFRLSNAFGYPLTEISQWHLVALDFCKQAVEKNEIAINSNAEIARDFISISSVCKAVDHFIQKEAEQGIYNLSSGDNLTLLSLASDIKKIIKNKFDQNIGIIERQERKPVQNSRILSDKIKKAGAFVEDDYSRELESLVEYCYKKFNYR